MNDKISAPGSGRKRERPTSEVQRLREELAAERRAHEATRVALRDALHQLAKLDDLQHVEPGPFPAGLDEPLPPKTKADIPLMAVLELEGARVRLAFPSEVSRERRVRRLVAGILQKHRMRDFPARGLNDYTGWRNYWPPRWMKAVEEWPGLKGKGRRRNGAPSQFLVLVTLLDLCMIPATESHERPDPEPRATTSSREVPERARSWP